MSVRQNIATVVIGRNEGARLHLCRQRLDGRQPGSQAFFLTLGKLPEAQGILTYLWRQFTRPHARLIEFR